MNRSIHSKFLAFLLALVMVFSMLPVSAMAAEETATWSKVELEDIEPTDTIAITMTTSDGTTYVLDNANGTKSAPVAVIGTVSENMLTTTTASSSTLGWNIESTEDGYVIYKAKTEADEADTWLYSTNANNGVRVGTNDAKIWVLDEASGYLKHVGTSRYLGVYTTTPDWRAYNNTTGNTKDQTLGFWKLENISSEDPDPVQTVATPTASHAPGAVEAGTTVTFSCETEGAVIQYHTGDGAWITASTAVVDAATTFTVKATKEGMNDSAEAMFAYTVATEEPVEPSDTIADGSYVIWEAGNGKAATALEQSKTYGYLQTVDVTQTEAGLTGCMDTEIWTITNVSDGQFTVQDANGKYYYMTGSYNSFNVAADAPASGYLWTAAANEDGTWAITNVEMDKTIAYDTSYTSFGAYAEPTETQLTALTLTPASEIVKTEEPEKPEEPETPEQPKRYVGVKISSMEELVSGKYVLVASNGYAPTTLDSGWILAEAVTPADGKIVNPADNLVWTVTVDGSGVTLTDSNGVSIAPKGGNNNGIVSGSYSWAVTCTDGVFQFAGQGSDTVLLASNTVSANKFRAYKTATVSGNPNGYPSEFTLYKLEPARESGVVTDLSTLQDGDTVVVFNPANAVALSTSYTGYYNQGTAVTLTDGVLTGYTDADIWTLGINEDGTYTFSTVEGKKLSMGASYTSTPLDDVNVDWNITAAETKDCVYIQNAARGNYLEWYASKENWSTYTKISDEALFAQQIYLVVEEAGSSDTSLPAEGDQVVIYNLSAQGVLAAQSDNESIENALTEIVDGKAVPGNGGVIFTVKKNGDYF
ncbi:MAG: chitobiase/beta-hexosaminidase C-terminal domain-containing protein, partial [Faecousia sp.]